MPFINDTEENIRGILRYCIEAKVYGILLFGMGVTLRDGDRQYFYKKLDEHFPGMKEKYITTYENQYEVQSENSKELLRIFESECKSHGIVTGVDNIFSYLHKFEEKEIGKQLSLFDYMK